MDASCIVVIVIRIHVEQTCEWQPCFPTPIPQPFIHVLLQLFDKEHRHRQQQPREPQEIMNYPISEQRNVMK